jgi:hypothetical protein
MLCCRFGVDLVRARRVQHCLDPMFAACRSQRQLGCICGPHIRQNKKPWCQGGTRRGIHGPYSDGPFRTVMCQPTHAPRSLSQ